ncbi:FAD-binding oxidoreductase [Mameliella alba]|uniref:Oxidoreductase n=1 Tax=Mameliella alba TaxID=561184 RepID=A0A0B3RX02_9RHOB|nr:FAD-binding oxidoreductase [Mameliella alba]KHQ51273.1 Oxidoreductase [Mameliella alba]
MKKAGIQLDADCASGLTELAAALGTKAVLTEPADCDRYASDQSGLIGARPLAVLRPANTEEVAQALRICTRHRIAVVPQGGRTGLSGGASSPAGAVVLSTERMTGVIELDRQGMTMTVWAGTPLETVQTTAREAGLDYPVDIGARGTATIGGTIATNAGGIRVLQHGMTRQNVLGLEAVLADGTILSRLGKTMKDNSGLDLKHLLIGSEGTLGVVTRAVLQLRQNVPDSALALIAVPDHAAALSCLSVARRWFGSRICAFEGMWPDYWDFVCRRTSLAEAAISGQHGFYVLIEVETDHANGEDALETFFAELFENGFAEDGVLAKSLAETQSLWRIREAVGEVDPDFGPHINFDIAVAPSELGKFCESADDLLEGLQDAAGTLKVGHVADGNVHLLVAHDGSAEAEERIETAIYELLSDWNGAVTAEHGVGRLKVRWITHSRSREEMAVMHTLKRQLDPFGILNPGALFGVPES